MFGYIEVSFFSLLQRNVKPIIEDDFSEMIGRLFQGLDSRLDETAELLQTFTDEQRET